MAKETKEQKNLRFQEETRERAERALLAELEELRRAPLPPPRYHYTLGEEVLPRTAHWHSMIVLEVLDEGKILLCEITSKNKTETSTSKRYLNHLNLLPKSLKLAPEKHSPLTKEMRFSSREIFGFFLSHYQNDYNYNPEYQRDLCWTLDDKIKLIHSIFMDADIGKFAFIQLPYKENSPSYEVLDGKQRLNALVEFYEDKFKYDGHYFSELHPRDKHHFKSYVVSVGMSEHDDWTESDKMEYFLRMNTTGVPQDQGHLNKVKSMLKKVNRDK